MQECYMEVDESEDSGSGGNSEMEWPLPGIRRRSLTKERRSVACGTEEPLGTEEEADEDCPFLRYRLEDTTEVACVLSAEGLVVTKAGGGLHIGDVIIGQSTLTPGAVVQVGAFRRVPLLTKG